MAADSGFTYLGQGDFLGLPVPAIILRRWRTWAASVLLNYTRFGRHVLALGGNEEAARLMGLPVDRTKIAVYTLSGALAGLAGVILAAQFDAGQPDRRAWAGSCPPSPRSSSAARC